MPLPLISFRQRILFVLLLLGAVPAALLGGGWAATLLRFNPARSSRAALEPVSTSGRELLRILDTTRMNQAEHRALHAHVRALENSLTLSQRGFFYSRYKTVGLALAVAALSLLLLYAALLVVRSLSRQLSKPIDELLGWTARIRRYESLPPEDAGRRGAPEFASLRTALRETAASLQQARHAELDSERLRAFREVARRVAHEMKNPLTPVRFAIGQIGKTAQPEQQEALEVLRVETARLERLARDFANLGRLPEGPAAMVDLGELLTELLRTSLSERMRHSLTVEPGSPHIVGHYDPLRRAFSNLIRNAVEACGGEGAIDVIVSPDGEGVRVSLADHGPGVPGDRRNRIFEPYVTDKVEGTGLGLAIVKQAVDFHHGAIEVSETPGGGGDIHHPASAEPGGRASRARGQTAHGTTGRRSEREKRMKPRVLIVDDEANIRRMLAALLKAEGFETEEAPNGNAALLTLDQVHPDAILLDLQMPPGPDGLETLRLLRERDVSTPVIMMSGKAQLTDAVRAIKLGAFQFLEKPLTPEAVLVALRSGLELTRARAENRALRSQLGQRADLVGTSGKMDEVRALIAQVAPTEARVLIIGESGTGKELVAHAIHRASSRAGRSFISVNCAAIPRDLVESEMFGHERGAFTGATDRRLGRFELADGGTLFLDEVGDLNLEAQAKLLRVLEAGEIQRLGAERVQRIDVRILAATNQRLEQAVAAGSFREDLYFRLNVFPLQLSPLRDRLEDLPDLIVHLAERVRPLQAANFTADALALMASYEWPGNVRELANIIERLSILGGPEVDVALVRQVLPRAGSLRFDAPSESESGTSYSVADLAGRSLSNVLDDYERALIGAALRRATGNVAEAARALQTDRANLYRRMKRLGL